MILLWLLKCIFSVYQIKNYLKIMGNQSLLNDIDLSWKEFPNILFPENMHNYFNSPTRIFLQKNQFNYASIIPTNDQLRIKYSSILQKIVLLKNFDPSLFQFDIITSRAIAVFLGLSICGALGDATQFIKFDKNRRYITRGFKDIQDNIQKGRLNKKVDKAGIWTDDCSMALCIADSLIVNNYELNHPNLRYLFILWLENGLNNGGKDHSTGLGGNISISLNQFIQQKANYAKQEDKYNNENGALMCLAPIPICFYNDENKAMKISAQCSRITHYGQQSQQCSRLLTLIIVRLINRKKNIQDKNHCIVRACNNFITKSKTVSTLAKSQIQTQQLFNQQSYAYGQKFNKFNRSVSDRNWNWQDRYFTYSPTRISHNPRQIGSYCMDALSMALHIVFYSDSFFQVAIKSANMGGNSETVGAIAGQIAGAAFGLDRQMLRFYSEMQDSRTGSYQVFLRALKIFKHQTLIFPNNSAKQQQTKYKNQIKQQIKRYQQSQQDIKFSSSLSQYNSINNLDSKPQVIQQYTINSINHKKLEKKESLNSQRNSKIFIPKKNANHIIQMQRNQMNDTECCQIPFLTKSSSANDKSSIRSIL